MEVKDKDKMQDQVALARGIRILQAHLHKDRLEDPFVDGTVIGWEHKSGSAYVALRGEGLWFITSRTEMVQQGMTYTELVDVLASPHASKIHIATSWKEI